MACSKCGAELPANAFICRKCGTVVPKTSAEQDRAEAVPALPTSGALPQPTPPQSTSAQFGGVSQTYAPQQGYPPASGQYGGTSARFSYPQGSYPQGYGQQPLPNAHDDGKATASLILGIVSCMLCFGPLTGIPAIILGHISRGNIQRSRGQLKGSGKALAGLILGYLSIAMIPVFLIVAAIAIPNLVRSRIAANEADAVRQIRSILTAQSSYQNVYAQKGYAPDLATLGPGAKENCQSGDAVHACLLDSPLTRVTCTARSWCMASGYMFLLNADSSEPHSAYTISAVPQMMFQTGNVGFCATEDGVIHVDRSHRQRIQPYTLDECKALKPL